MRRLCLLIAVFLVSTLPVADASAAETGRVVTKRYGGASEVPKAIACGLPSGPWSVGFGSASVSFPTLPGERTVDIAIADDNHDNPVIAYVTHSRIGPGSTGTWICGAREGIRVTPGRTLNVFLPQSFSAPVITGTVRATFRKTTPTPMTQKKSYRSASSLSARAQDTGQCCPTIGEQVRFPIPTGARSARITIVDASGLPVSALLSGAIDRKPDTDSTTICGPTSVEVTLVRGARVLGVSPSLGATPFDTLFGGNYGHSCHSPVSAPTKGTVTVVFSGK